MKSLGETGFILHMAEGHFQNGNEDGGNSGQKNTILQHFFSRKATFTYAFQENTVFTFTLLVLKGLNGNSSLRD